MKVYIKGGSLSCSKWVERYIESHNHPLEKVGTKLDVHATKQSEKSGSGRWVLVLLPYGTKRLERVHEMYYYTWTGSFSSLFLSLIVSVIDVAISHLSIESGRQDRHATIF